MIGFVSEWNWDLKIGLQGWVKFVMEKNKLPNVLVKKEQTLFVHLLNHFLSIYEVFTIGTMLRDTMEDGVAMERKRSLSFVM